MKLNNKGLATSFILLIFLLIILGVYYFMKPYFDKAMEASRKKSFISDARAYVSGARNMWTQGDLECQESGDKSNFTDTSEIKPGRSNVVLMHDFAGNHKTMDALDSVITWGLEQGYVFRRITEETPMVKHHVNN